MTDDNTKLIAFSAIGYLVGGWTGAFVGGILANLVKAPATPTVVNGTPTAAEKAAYLHRNGNGAVVTKAITKETEPTGSNRLEWFRNRIENQQPTHRQDEPVNKASEINNTIPYPVLLNVGHDEEQDFGENLKPTVSDPFGKSLTYRD